VDQSVSGIGVLDKAVAIIDALDKGPLPLSELVATTGLPKATVHRIALAMETHGLVQRDGEGRYGWGVRLAAPSLASAARPALEQLRDTTGESTQLYVRRGDVRVCVASIESPHSLRTIVPVGAALPLSRGSAGRVFRGEGPWAESVEEREKGVASVSAPVVHDGRVFGAVSVSGPVERTTRAPGKRYAKAVVAAARQVEEALGWQ
jgi:DNA-binding IclR family transcriptional regulator